MNRAEDFEQKKKVIVLYLCRYLDNDSAGRFSRFVDSYKKHPAGYEHDLFIIKKGFQEHEETWNAWSRQLDGIPFQTRVCPEHCYPTGYIRDFLEEFPEYYILTCVASSEILVDGWLDLFLRHANPNRILSPMWHYTRVPWWTQTPLTWKSFLRSSRTTRRQWWLQFWGCDVELQDWQVWWLENFYPCSLYLRAVFMTPPHILEKIYWPRKENVFSKCDDYLFEFGKFGMIVQALLAGLEPLVVRADGQSYAIEEWHRSNTFIEKWNVPNWVGEYKNIIIGDYRTQYKNLPLEAQVRTNAENPPTQQEIDHFLRYIRSSDTSSIEEFFLKRNYRLEWME